MTKNDSIFFSLRISKVIEFFSIFQSIVATLALLATKYKADVPLLRLLLFIFARLRYIIRRVNTEQTDGIGGGE